jgi:hypothetical protein
MITFRPAEPGVRPKNLAGALGTRALRDDNGH